MMTTTTTTEPAIIRFMQTEPTTIIRAVANYLNQPIKDGDQLLNQPNRTKSPTNKFQAQSKPTIDTHDYLTRLITLCPLSIDGVLLGVVYLQRITHFNQPRQAEEQDLIPINSLTIHRLILSTLILGTKFISDRPLARKRLSKVAGVSELELDHLERELLDRLDFKLCWSNDELIKIIEDILEPAQSTTTTSTTPTSDPSPITTSSTQSSSSSATITSSLTASLLASASLAKSTSHRASFPATINTNAPGPATQINALLRRHSTSKGLVFVKSQFIDSNLLAEKYGFSTHHSQSTNHLIDNLDHLVHPTNHIESSTSTSSPSSSLPNRVPLHPRSTSKILVTRLEHNQIKICHAQVF
ncbi:hypothetical protein MJO28_005795 [Puccinia striiformis f. sp. tritici]|uniref:Cyclin N-terminal domain-containing protein n=4 Tax=Puccinia striiformis TaxID=27350 RepID=A0A0L0UZJ9_9BASI